VFEGSKDPKVQGTRVPKVHETAWNPGPLDPSSDDLLVT
jgi:hypothetical protein